MQAAVRTVLGDVPAHDLGRVNYHEHLFQVSPLLPGDELDDEGRSGQEAGLLRQAGTRAMVEATPIGLGRNPAALARISASTGLRIIATSGAHREAHYGAGHWLTDLSEAELARRFTADIESGLPESDGAQAGAAAQGPAGAAVRAGLLKAGIGYWDISLFERRVLAAVAVAHRSTGAPIMVHLEHGSAAFEVLAVLERDGVSPDAVVLAHIDRNPDPVLHADLAAAGAYLGYDGFARSRTWPDSIILSCMCAAADLGAQGRILLGGDVARRTRYVAYGGMPGLTYLEDRIVPRLIRAGRGELLEAALTANPARWLGRFSRPATPSFPPVPGDNSNKE
jgi:phosphotriesterase-related protein